MYSDGKQTSLRRLKQAYRACRACPHVAVVYSRALYKKEWKAEGRRSATGGMSNGWRLAAELLGEPFTAERVTQLTG